MRLVVSTLLLAAVAVCSAYAADWPQFRGPERNNVSKETGLLKKWPADGPKLRWTFKDAGVGYSGPAVVGKVGGRRRSGAARRAVAHRRREPAFV